MEDANGAAPSKKRIAGRQLTKDNPGDNDDDVPEGEMGTFKKATDEVLATRRIVKVRRHSQQTTSSPNPFAGIQLVPPSDSGAKTTANIGSEAANGNVLLDEEGHSGKQEIYGKDKATDTGASLNDQVDKAATEDQNHVSLATVNNGDQSVGSVNATDEKNDGVGQTEKEGITVNREEGSFKEEQAGKEGVEETGKETKEYLQESVMATANRSNTEENEKETQENDDKGKQAPSVPFSFFQQLSSSQNAFTGLAGTGFSSSAFSFGPTSSDGSVFGKSSESAFGVKGDNPLFSFGTGNSDKGALSLGSAANGGSNKTSLQEVPVETGEENEKSVFTADAILFEYIDSAWKERGKGELKVNISMTGNEKARLVMRARGNYRLILNARLYPDMSIKNMEKRGATFACINTAGEGNDALATFALKFRDSSAVEEFCESVTAHKGNKTTSLKTPENSP